MKKASVIALVALLWSCSKKEPVAAERPSETAATPTEEAAEAAKGTVKQMNVDLLVSAPTDLLANEQVSFVPVEQHHFELKAPQECGDFEFSEKSARKLTCQIAAPGKHEISLNVCTDDKSSCKPVHYTLSATAPRGFVAGAESRKVLQPPTHAHPPVAGFLINQPDEAVAAAKSEGKLLYIHFFGIWCPPCNMLEEYVYGEKSFLDATKGMVRVMIDADSDLSWPWKARFKVGGYPTVVIATARLEEITRVVGYRPVAQMVKLATTAESNRARPIAKLLAEHDIKTAAQAPPQVRKRLGMYYFERKEWAKAQTWLSGLKDREARKNAMLAEQKLASDDESKVLEVTKNLLVMFPDDIEYSSWVKDLIDAKAPVGKLSVSNAFSNLEKWSNSPDLADTGYCLADLSWLEADLRGAMGDEDGAKAGYLRSADLYGEMAKDSSLKVARGANMERAYALHKAGEDEQSKALYEELASAYAEEFSFNYNYAYVLHDLKEYDAALAAVQKAVAHAYGDNLLRAHHLEAKIQHAKGDDAAALGTIDAALAEAVVPRSTAVRTHRYVANLRKLRKEVAMPPPTDEQ